MNEIISQVAASLIEQKKMLAVAESCTGGWLAKVCTDLPGSSRWFDRGFVTYSYQAKYDMLGVKSNTIDSYGAVSQQTVEEMVAGAIQHSCADYAIAISGVAGQKVAALLILWVRYGLHGWKKIKRQ